MSAAWVTIRFALMSATIGTALGMLAALTLVRFGRFPGRLLFSGMIYAPLVMPEVITGLSLLLLFVAIGLDRDMMTVTIAHTTFTMCYAAIVIQSRLLTFDRSLEEAAQDLGCPPVRTFFKITCRSSCRRCCPAGCWPSPVARRSGHRELYHGAGCDDAADQDLQPGASGRDAGNQCRLQHPDRHRHPRCYHRVDHDKTRELQRLRDEHAAIRG